MVRVRVMVTQRASGAGDRDDGPDGGAGEDAEAFSGLHLQPTPPITTVTEVPTTPPITTGIARRVAWQTVTCDMA